MGISAISEKGSADQCQSRNGAGEKNVPGECITQTMCDSGRQFYEWDAEKNKAAFREKNESVMFMAGFYNRFSDGDRFIILTTGANIPVVKTKEKN